VGGRTGTFLLQDAGTVAGGIVSGDWFVIPGSGTGGLAGLRGTGGFRADLGEGAQVHLDYGSNDSCSPRLGRRTAGNTAERTGRPGDAGVVAGGQGRA